MIYCIKYFEWTEISTFEYSNIIWLIADIRIVLTGFEYYFSIRIFDYSPSWHVIVAVCFSHTLCVIASLEFLVKWFHECWVVKNLIQSRNQLETNFLINLRFCVFCILASILFCFCVQNSVAFYGNIYTLCLKHKF